VTFASFVIQLLNGLAAASALFLVSAGLSLIFGVTRIVNFAHGSLYMLGLYGAYSLIEALGRTPLGFWSAVILAALAVGLVGVVSFLDRRSHPVVSAHASAKMAVAARSFIDPLIGDMIPDLYGIPGRVFHYPYGIYGCG